MTTLDGHPIDDRPGPATPPGAHDSRRREDAHARHEAVAALFDPVTRRHLDELGVGPGWRCWEIGAGGASVASWLAKKAGPTGKVLLTDSDVSWAEATDRQVETRTHRLGRDEPPGEGFDLVHARLALVHTPDRDRALRSMIRALRPGGRLLVEDADLALQPLVCPEESGPEQRLANRLRLGLRDLLAEHGVDLAYGRSLPRLLREAGLARVEADVYFPLAAEACGALEAATVRQARGALVAAGAATEEEIDRHLANVATGAMDLAATPLVSVRARRP
ncbi:class I SAM-dependent methyltransferase [Streptomyces chilikensis]|uniref:Methyltransferase domain-containing protein n=1 Tax=Streptomyces chilikensis TaxID=1194079 RepID=A0ABV3EUD1_9ACTN